MLIFVTLILWLEEINTVITVTNAWKLTCQTLQTGILYIFLLCHCLETFAMTLLSFKFKFIS